MRLLTVGSLPPEWGGPRRGGVATFHASLLTGLLERPDDVRVLGAVPPGPLDRQVAVPVYVRPEGVGRADFYAELLERLQPDAVLMNHIAHTIGVTHAQVSEIPALGVVHSWHNVTFATGEEERERAMALTQRAMTGLAALIAPSRHALEEGRGLGFRYPARAEAIHNPLPSLYADERIEVDRAERRGVLYLGSLIPRKAPAALVEAAALTRSEVLFAGSGELERELRLLIERRRLEDRVRIASLPESGHLLRVRDLLLGAEVMCLPSRSESFGLAFIEALACGTPVVGFAPTVREIARAMGIDVGVPLERGAPEEVAAAIEHVRATEWDRDRLRRVTLETFGLPRVTERYVELLRGVTGEGGRG